MLGSNYTAKQELLFYRVDAEAEQEEFLQLKFAAPPYEDILSQDNSVYPTPNCVTLEGISSWYVCYITVIFDIFEGIQMIPLLLL